MWMSKNIASSSKDEKAERGSVTLSSNEFEAGATLLQRDVKSYGPYGYCANLPVGEEVMVIPFSNGQAVVGSLSYANDLESGEIRISSKGGATIILYNDGSIALNSLKINKNGEIIND